MRQKAYGMSDSFTLAGYVVAIARWCAAFYLLATFLTVDAG
jgi:hypothetical protein